LIFLIPLEDPGVSLANPEDHVPEQQINLLEQVCKFLVLPRVQCEAG